MNLSTSKDSSASSTAATANGPRRFLFDLSFDNEVALRNMPKKEKEKPTFSEEDLAAAKKEALEAGVAAGKNAMLDSQQQQMNLMLSALENKLKNILDQATDYHDKQMSQMRQIALVIMRKLMPAYVEKHGFAEIEKIIEGTIVDMNQEPRLVIRVAQEQFEQANERLSALAQQQAYAGKLIILEDADLASSDCRIEWADGGIERDERALWLEIDRVLGMKNSLEAATVKNKNDTEASLESATESRQSDAQNDIEKTELQEGNTP